MATMNLIPMERQVRNARINRVRAWSYAGGGLTTALGLLWACCAAAPSQVDAPSAEMFSKAAAEMTKANEEALPRRRELASLQEKVASRQYITEQPDFSLLLALLSQVTGDDVVLNHCELTHALTPAEIDRAQLLRIGGMARSQPSVAAFMLALEGTGIFKNVTLVRSNEQPLMNAQVAGFQIQCTIGPVQQGGQ
ncbi:MAG TPA: PilN domain-containing protein [Tepidisphaeraceae bacterium]|jgi:Tfp pilus assembly protein PilN